ncbi:MAG: LysR family transcriptional regulator [Rhodospirillales bacterium]
MTGPHEMAVFVSVVQEGSFSAAAKVLRQTPSAVSKQIGRLEDRLGVRLLNRTTRRLSLTEVGAGYVERARRILADIDEAERLAASAQVMPRGHLRINAPNSFGQRFVTPLIPAFLDRYPEVDCEVTLTDRVTDVVDEGIDVAIRIAALLDSSLIARKLAPNHRLIAASPAYLERYGRPLVPSDVRSHEALRFSFQSSLNNWEFQYPNGHIERIEIHGRFQANNSEALLEAAVGGAGLVRLAKFIMADEVRKGRLVTVLDDFIAPEPTDIHAVYAPGRHLSPKVRAFVDYLADHFLPVPPWEDCRPGTA